MNMSGTYCELFTILITPVVGQKLSHGRMLKGINSLEGDLTTECVIYIPIVVPLPHHKRRKKNLYTPCSVIAQVAEKFKGGISLPSQPKPATIKECQSRPAQMLETSVKVSSPYQNAKSPMFSSVPRLIHHSTCQHYICVPRQPFMHLS
jgi:hypothetical protein